MRTRLLFLLLAVTTFTAAHAQNIPVPVDTTTVIFQRGTNGWLLDSLSVRTSLQGTGTGIPFTADSLTIAVIIAVPTDEFFLTGYAKGNAFTETSCWIGTDTSRLRLTIESGRTVVDSSSAAPVERIVRRQVAEIAAAKTPAATKQLLLDKMLGAEGTLVGIHYLTALLAFPDYKLADLDGFYAYLERNELLVGSHPYLEPAFAKLSILYDERPVRLRQYGYLTHSERRVRYTLEDSEYYLVDLYQSQVPGTPAYHEALWQLTEMPEFAGVEVVSISMEPNTLLWRDYVTKNRFPWPHLQEDPEHKGRVSDRLFLLPGNRLILLDKRRRAIGVYDTPGEVLRAMRILKGQ